MWALQDAWFKRAGRGAFDHHIDRCEVDVIDGRRLGVGVQVRLLVPAKVALADNRDPCTAVSEHLCAVGTCYRSGEGHDDNVAQCFHNWGFIFG